MNRQNWCIVQQMLMIAQRRLEYLCGIIEMQGGLFMDMTNREKEALWYKMDHPDESVKCPRCGGEILYVTRGNSISIECEKDDCIFGGIRGI